MHRRIATAAVLVLTSGMAFGAAYRLYFQPKYLAWGAYAARPHAMLGHTWGALEMFKLEQGRYPSTEEGLKALISHGNLKAIPLDRWGRPLNYRFPSNRPGFPFELWSYGADGVEGGVGENRDIGNWNDDG